MMFKSAFLILAMTGFSSAALRDMTRGAELNDKIKAALAELPSDPEARKAYFASKMESGRAKLAEREKKLARSSEEPAKMMSNKDRMAQAKAMRDQYKQEDLAPIFKQAAEEALAAREKFMSMTPEQREEHNRQLKEQRQKLEKLSPEEREAHKRQRKEERATKKQEHRATKKQEHRKLLEKERPKSDVQKIMESDAYKASIDRLYEIFGTSPLEPEQIKERLAEYNNKLNDLDASKEINQGGEERGRNKQKAVEEGAHRRLSEKQRPMSDAQKVMESDKYKAAIDRLHGILGSGELDKEQIKERIVAYNEKIKEMSAATQVKEASEEHARKKQKAVEEGAHRRLEGKPEAAGVRGAGAGMKLVDGKLLDARGKTLFIEVDGKWMNANGTPIHNPFVPQAPKVDATKENPQQ